MAIKIVCIHFHSIARIETSSIRGHISLLTIIEEYSQFTKTYQKKANKEALELVLNSTTWFDEHFGNKNRKIRGNRGFKQTRVSETLARMVFEISKYTVYVFE